MKRFGFLLAFLFVCGSAMAADIALIYENEGAVAAGKFTQANLVPEGAVVPAGLAMKGNVLVGKLGGSLYKSSLIRLDTDLDLALLRLTQPVSDQALQAAHQKKSAAILG